MANGDDQHSGDIRPEPPYSPTKSRRGGGNHRLPPRHNFTRQVSLETGFAALQEEANGGKRSSISPSGEKHDRGFLSRNGKSLGPTAAADGVGYGPRKADFSMFRTKSTLNRQQSVLPMRKDSRRINLQTASSSGGAAGIGGLDPNPEDSVNQSVPAGRYFAALRGPELDEVKESEDILLPKDEVWPFLLRFPINSFGICLGLGSQAILWGAMATSPAMAFLHVSPYINLSIWITAVFVLLLISATYALKAAFYLEAVRREYFHPVRLNFFFAPWIACMFLAIGAPPSLSPSPSPSPSSCLLIAPVFLLQLKIYGQWLSGGKRRLCKVANPSSHLSVVGNFVGAILFAKVGWVEPAKFLWAVGIAHYLCVFVTLYQRLPTSQTLPKELHPVYSMFIATPSAASIAWNAIYGHFDAVSRTFYFIALFLFTSLVIRINFFWGFKFSMAWWSYTFSMTTVSLASIRYAEEVPTIPTKVLALGLALMSSTIVSLLFVSTLLHGFVWRSLFPNDLAIAISRSRPLHSREKKKGYDIRRWAKKSLASGSVGHQSHSADHDSDADHK